MRSFRIVLALTMVAVAAPSMAQMTLDMPLDGPEPFFRDSGELENPSGSVALLHTEEIYIAGAASMRLYFGDDVVLGPNSFIRITSDFDGEVQELDAAGLAMWSNTSAYFNGDSITVELVAGPRTTRNRVQIRELSWQAGVAMPAGSCGICGPDDRVPTLENFAARLLPAGCSATVYNTDSCMVSAGHCISGAMVLQFNVPPSTAGCNIVNPPILDQFPSGTFQFVNGGTGNDWSVMTIGTNGAGEKPFDRYGLLKPIAQDPPQINDVLTIWGYGIDDQCTRTQVQQSSSGLVVSVSSNLFRHDVDATFGNSGSSLIRNGQEILGIATHCPCPNWATRFDQPAFAAARENVCPTSATAVGLTAVNVIIGTLSAGGLPEAESSDDSYVDVTSARSTVRHNTLTEFTAQSPFTTVSQLNLTVEFGTSPQSPIFTAVQLFNHDTGQFDNLQFGLLGAGADTLINLPDVSNPNAYVGAGGEVRVRVGETSRKEQTPGGFTKRIDQVTLTVQP